MKKIAVLAAAGHTGRLVVDALRQQGADPLPLTRRDVDARDRSALAKHIAGCDAIVNLAGPFLQNGLAPVEAAIDAGIPYVDTTGEQAFMALVRDTLDARARDAGVPIINALAYEYALGDLAAKARFPEGGRTLHILYRSPGARASAGTKKSVLRVMGSPTLSYENGQLTRVTAARHAKTFATRDGPRTGVTFAGGEVLTVPRHTPFATVRTYFANRRPTLARALAPLARATLHGAILRTAERYVDRNHRTPHNERARGEVHLVTEPNDRHIVVTTGDPYAATAQIATTGALTLANMTTRKGGVLSPAEAFDAATFLAKLPDVTVEEFTP